MADEKMAEFLSAPISLSSTVSTVTSDSDTWERRNPENVGKDSPIASVRGILSHVERRNDSIEREEKINRDQRVGVSICS